jgi:hypothetical protein
MRSVQCVDPKRVLRQSIAGRVVGSRTVALRRVRVELSQSGQLVALRALPKVALRLALLDLRARRSANVVERLSERVASSRGLVRNLC